jgi:hypothetical protein
MMTAVHLVFVSARALATDKVGPAWTNSVVTPSLTGWIVNSLVYLQNMARYAILNRARSTYV